jgi:uncharacterized membrane protein YdjX (TVP38/TMEM64 family)
MKSKTKSVIGVLVIVILFVLVSYFMRENFGNVSAYIGDGYYGAFVYVVAAIIATVFAPLSAIPLLPIVSNIYGWFIAGLLSIIGWTIGSAIAFLLARKFGMPLVKRVVSLEKIGDIEKRIPKENMFWSIVFLRIAIPVDILSYLLGLFSHIKFRTYFWATLVGVTPFAFILAYLGNLDLIYQLSLMFTGFMVVILIFLISQMRNKKV